MVLPLKNSGNRSTHAWPTTAIMFFEVGDMASAATSLASVARQLVSKGILAADEGVECLWSRFQPYGIPCTLDNRVKLRRALFRAVEGVSGVILFEDTFEHREAAGGLLTAALAEQGVLYGITVDAGTVELAGTHGEVVTQGLDDLLAKCRRYRELGASFTKFRALIQMDVTRCTPSAHGIAANARVLARYASIAQEAGLVPIVEPELNVFDGAHGIDESARLATEVLSCVFRELQLSQVQLDGIVLKPIFVVPGRKCPQQCAPAEIAAATLRVLQYCVPPAVRGIAFLSGGLSEDLSSRVLNAMNKLPGPRPWRLTFSFGRALQQSALQAWLGKSENVPALQAAFRHRVQLNLDAAAGKLE